MNRGFIALTSAVIISSVLLGLAATVSTTSYFSRFNALNGEYKRISLGLAESCVSATLLKFATNYNYTGNETIAIGTEACTIRPIPPGDCLLDATNHKKTCTIKTRAQYKGAYSNIIASAIIQDPTFTPTIVPTCAMAVSSPTVPAGEDVIFSWSTAGGASSFQIDHGVGSGSVPTGTSGPVTVPMAIGPITYTGTVGNAAGSRTCEITITVAPPPPAPSCADTVMILDRTGSISSSDRANEKSAANKLIDLYASVSPAPKVGVGSFGAYPNQGLPAGAAAIAPNGTLSTAFNTLKSALNAMMNSSSSVGSNLAAAIDVSKTELNSSRHTLDKPKVLIFVSDGLPNQPSSANPGDTGFKFPTANAADATGESWSNPTGAYSNGGGDANDPVSENDQHRLYNFGFSLPAGATIAGIEARAEAWITETLGGVGTFFSDTFGIGSTDSSFDESPTWTEDGSNGAEKRAIGTGVDTASPSGGRFAVIENNSWICESVSASGFTGLQLSYNWRGDPDANESSDDGIVEYRTGGSCSSSTGWSTLQNHDLQNDGAWSTQSAFNLPSSLNNTTFYLRYRANSDNNEYFRVDGVSITGTGGSSTSCQLGVDLSWNGGSSWSSEKIQNLTQSEVAYTLGSATDDWGSHAWQASELSNTNFRARVRAVDGGGGCSSSAVVHLDTLELRAHYTQPISPFEAALNSADAAKIPHGADNLPMNIFTIHYGENDGRNFLAQLASGSTNNIGHQPGSQNNAGTSNSSALINQENNDDDNFFISPSSSDLEDIFETVGRKVCPAVSPGCSNGIDDDWDGFIDSADPACHTDLNPANPASYNPNLNDEWTDPTPPSPPPPPPAPPNISVGSWREVPKAE